MLFGDDLSIHVTSDIQVAQEILQRTVDKIVQCGTDQGLTFSKEKSTSIIFSYKKQSPTHIDLKLED